MMGGRGAAVGIGSVTAGLLGLFTAWHFPSWWKVFSETGLQGLLLLLFVLVAALIGRRVLVLIRLAPKGLSAIVLAVAIGYGVLGLAILAYALLGLLYEWMIWLTFAAVLLASARDVGGLWREATRHRRVEQPPSRVEIVLFSLLGFFVVVTLLNTLTPPTSRDALAHHLALPKLYTERHRMVELPFALFSYYPMGVDMLYVAAMLVGKDVLAKLLHFSFYLLTIAAIYAYAAPLWRRPFALLGALLFAAIPLVSNLGSWAYVDLGLALYTLLASAALIRWLEAEERAWLLAAAILCGFALGTKYNGLVVFALLSLGMLQMTQSLGYAPGRAIRRFLSLVAIAGAIASPWFIKNLVQTGNPLYPFWSQVLGGRAWQPERLGFTPWVVRRVLHGQTWLDELLLPFTLSTKWTSPLGFEIDGPLGPVLLMGLILFLAVPGKRRDMVYGAWFSLLYYLVVWLRYGVRLRYFMPIIPVLTVITVAGVASAFTLGGRLTRGCVIAALAGVLVFDAIWAVRGIRQTSPFPYLAGEQSRDAYLERHISDYPAYQFMNRKLPETAKVMFLFTGNDGYYCDREYLYDTYYLGYTIQTILKGARSPAQVRNSLADQGITHLFINWYFLDRSFAVALPEEQHLMFRAFASGYLEPLYRLRWVGVYRLRSD